MSLNDFIARVQSISQSDDPEEALSACRTIINQKMREATTPLEKAEAYKYYKAFYEHQAYLSESD